MIEVRDLVFEYPNKRALNGVTLTIEPGSITALVGPNGAGKSTLMRCIAALEAPYSGQVLIDGMDTRAEPRRIHERLAFLPDFFGLYDQLSVRRCLTFAGLAHGLRGAALERAVDVAAARVGLADRLKVLASELSRGLRQRLAIGQSIVHEPSVILLDEPAAGLDPDARRSLSQLFLDLKAAGMTLIVSSHILAELEDYSNAMLVIRDGRLVGGEAVNLTEEHVLHVVDLERPVAGFDAFLKTIPGVTEIDIVGTTVSFRLSIPDTRADVLAAIVAAGYRVTGFRQQRRTLEQAYLATADRPRP